MLGAGEPSRREGVGGSGVAKTGGRADDCAMGTGSPLDPAGRDRRAGEETGQPVNSVSPVFLDFCGSVDWHAEASRGSGGGGSSSSGSELCHEVVVG